MEFLNYIEKLKADNNISDATFDTAFVTFLVDNNWFGMKPEIYEDKVSISEQDILNNAAKLQAFAKFYNKDLTEKIEYLKTSLKIQYPQTAEIFNSFMDKANGHAMKYSLNSEYYLLDYLLCNLVDEITQLTDKEVRHLVEDSMSCLTANNTEILSIFLSYTKRNYKTLYVGDYFIESNQLENNDAYEIDEYCKILFHLFNVDYINENDMYYKACCNKDYIDTWLFIALHFICDLRNTDLLNMPHPELPIAANEVLTQIKEDSFSDKNAIKTLYSIIWFLQFAEERPNKTKDKIVAAKKFYVPKSVEIHMGKLFAIAEAHFQIRKCTGNLVRSVTSYKDINKNMGEEIGDLFLASNFHTRKANKSYMQIIEVLTDSVLGMEEDFHVKGYFLAALARSHKGDYGAFAKTTIKYLKDQKMTGYSPEFVARELFERGVLSYIPKMLLSIITNRDIDKLDVHTQTSILSNLSLTPKDVENTVSLTTHSLESANAIVKEIYKANDKREAITKILHRIGNSEAVSKNNNCFCLMSALGMKCPQIKIHNCCTCKYEISTKDTLLTMVHEVNRLKKEFSNTKDDIEKGKLKAAAFVVLDSLNEMINCYEYMYGKAEADIVREIIGDLYEKN